MVYLLFPILHSNTYSHIRSNRKRSSISDEINALPSSSKASLERVRNRSIEPHPPSIRRVPDYKVQDPIASISDPVTELKNPVKDPNWPDAAFTKPVSGGPHLASQVEDHIEEWTCGNINCKMSNKKHSKKCEECRWKLPVAYYIDQYGQAQDEEKAFRQLAGGEDGADSDVERPTGQAPGGGVWIPVVPGLKKERKPNNF
jgi:hypothetical protein